LGESGSGSWPKILLTQFPTIPSSFGYQLLLESCGWLGFWVCSGGRAGTMMVKPPSSVSFITCGSKSSGTRVGSNDFAFLRRFFTCAPSMTKTSTLTVPQPAWDCALLLSNSSGCVSRPADMRNRDSQRAWLHAPWFITNVPSARDFRIQRINVMAFMVAKSEALPTSSSAIGKTYVWPSTSTV
jgi:hypothetical protein